MTTIKFENINNMGNSASSPYLQRKHVRTVKYNSDKTTQTVSWQCWPEAYQYAYTYSSKKYYGYFAGGIPSARGGLYRYYGSAPKESSPGSGYYVLPEVKKEYRRNIFEGIRIREIKWKTYASGTSPDKVAWKTKSYANINSYNDSTITVNSSKNNEVTELEVTYELCTMGFPHRGVPFVWFSDSGGTYMLNGSYFTDTKPGKEPGRNYSKVSDAWTFSSFEWGDPRAESSSNKTKAGWTYKNGIAKDSATHADKTTYSSTKTWEYQTDYWKKNSKGQYAYRVEGEGWTNEQGQTPKYARKTCYWTYTRVYKDKFTSNGIVTIPAQLPAPNKPHVNAIKNHCSADTRGEEGTVKVTYTHPSSKGGFITMYAVQKNGSSCVSKTVYSNVKVSHNEVYPYEVKFDKLGFSRSAEVRYYVVATVDDPAHKGKSISSATGSPTSVGAELTTFWNSCATGHYYNEEPPAANVSVESSSDTTKAVKISWQHVTDPDGDSRKYTLYIARQNDAHNTKSEMFWGNLGTGTRKYEKSIPNITNNYYSVDMSSYDYLEDVKVWLKSHDDYKNSYYYSSSVVSLSKSKSPIVSITTSEILSNETNPITGSKMVDRTKGKVSVKYVHDKGIPGKVDIEAYQSSTASGDSGNFLKTIKSLVFDSTMINSNKTEHTQTFEIDFKTQGFTRSRTIKYYAKGIDNSGNKTYSDNVIKWSDCTYGHRFNDEPEPVLPWIANLSSMAADEKALLKWNVPKDPDGDTKLFYNIYLKCEDSSKNTKSKQFYGPYVSGTQKYHKEFTTSDLSLDIDLTSYGNDKLSVWIESHDNYANDYYYSGQILPFENSGVSPNGPKILTQYAHGEEGNLTVQYSHNTNKNGYISLYAMCKYKNGTIKTFTLFTDKYAINGESLKLTVDFVKTFGNKPTDRSCEIRYFATARTQGFDDTSTVPPGWKPDASMWGSWIGGHYFNEEPPKPMLRLDKDKTNLYKNAYFTWNATPDPDDDNVKYQVFFRAKSASYTYKDKYTYFYGQNKEEDLVMYCEMISETTNTSLNLDLTHYDTPGDEFDLWVRPWDTYHNSYYYNSDVIHFTKLEYNRPAISMQVTPIHGEKGNISITYTHPDASLPPEHEDYRDNTDGLVKLYAYIEGLEYSPIDITFLLNGNSSLDANLFKHNQTKALTVDFEKDLKCSRSKKISYYAIAKDANKEAGLSSSDYEYNKVPESERYHGHYFNGIPTTPDPYNGRPDTEDDKPIYDFNYTNIVWDAVKDPDDDIVDYFLYLKTPSALNESLITENFTHNNQVTSRQYARKYKIEPISDTVIDNISSYRYSIYKNGSYEVLYTKSSLCFRLDYLNNPVDWPESSESSEGKYSYWLESRDRYNNSYYNSSAEITRDRRPHEEPDKVKITCTPAHGEEGELHIKYTHPENLNAKISLYAYMDQEANPILIDKLEATFTPEQIFESEKNGANISVEFKHIVKFTNILDLKRSHNICYYAIAEDTLTGGLSDNRPPNSIPYNEKSTGHYYNEEPPCTTPMLLADMKNDFNLENVNYEDIPFSKITLVWKKVSDPDKDNVNYNIYMNGSSDKYESKTKQFFGNYNNEINQGEFNYAVNEALAYNLLDGNAYDISSIEDMNLKSYAEGVLSYNFHEQITPNSIAANETLIHKVTGEEYICHTFDISEYKENTDISIWIETDDNYPNSYYRSGKIFIVRRGHNASKIDAAWPKNYSTVYAKTPRIIIKLALDALPQEVIVFWKDTWYSNKNSEHVKYFSGPPKSTLGSLGEPDEYIVFRPPTSQTAIHHSKITYAVKVNNGCSESEPKWYEYMYDKFGNDFTDSKFIPLKYIHINELRPALKKMIDAYGKDFSSDEGFVVKDRVVSKNDIVDNNDYNEIATPLRNLNKYINEIDKSPAMDDDSNVVVKEDFDLIEYEEQAESDYMTSDYKEWKILLYLIQNM